MRPSPQQTVRRKRGREERERERRREEEKEEEGKEGEKEGTRRVGALCIVTAASKDKSRPLVSVEKEIEPQRK